MKKKTTKVLTEMGIIGWIPEDTVKIKIICTVNKNGLKEKYYKKFSQDDIDKMREDYLDSCGTWQLTDDEIEELKGFKTLADSVITVKGYKQF